MTLIATAFACGLLVGSIATYLMVSEPATADHVVSDEWRRNHIYTEGKGL